MADLGVGECRLSGATETDSVGKFNSTRACILEAYHAWKGEGWGVVEVLDGGMFGCPAKPKYGKDIMAWE